jgi:hypothetical protein
MDKKNHPNQINKIDKNHQKLSLASFLREQIAYVHAAQEQGFKLEIIYQSLKEQTPVALSYNTFAVQLYRHRKALKIQGYEVKNMTLNQSQINDLQKLQAKQAKLIKANLKNKLTSNEVVTTKNSVKNHQLSTLNLPVNSAQIQAIQQAMADLQIKQQLVTDNVLAKQETKHLPTQIEKTEVNFVDKTLSQTSNTSTNANVDVNANINTNINTNTQTNLVKEIRNIFKQTTDIADLI